MWSSDGVLSDAVDSRRASLLATVWLDSSTRQRDASSYSGPWFRVLCRKCKRVSRSWQNDPFDCTEFLVTWTYVCPHTVTRIQVRFQHHNTDSATMQSVDSDRRHMRDYGSQFSILSMGLHSSLRVLPMWRWQTLCKTIKSNSKIAFDITVSLLPKSEQILVYWMMILSKQLSSEI